MDLLVLRIDDAVVCEGVAVSARLEDFNAAACTVMMNEKKTCSEALSAKP